IITVGGYNYTTSANELAIPNVPIDAAAFAETALVYSALMGKAPSKAEVAKLTLDPYFEVRPLAERARLILEMPEYAAQYGASVPKVDLLDIQNGDILEDNHPVTVEAYDLGSDGLFGTHDDGEIRSVSFLLNGKIIDQMDGDPSTDLYSFSTGSGYVSGEYLLEVVVTSRSGLSSRLLRNIFIKSKGANLSITSPAHGSVLQKGDLLAVNYQSSKSVAGTSFLEINGKIRWSGMVEVNADMMQDSTLSLYDGTGRSPVVFELDIHQKADSYDEEIFSLRKMGTGDLTASVSSYSGPAEGIEFLVFIDGNGSQAGGVADSYSWMELGAFDYNATAEPITTSLHSLGYGVNINFTNTTAFEYGDAWHIKVTPSLHYVEIESEGLYTDRLAGTKRNLIRAINQANSKGETALRAYDPLVSGNLGGVLPLTTSAEEAIILRHDGSYPISESVYANRGTTKVSNDLFGLITATSGGTLSLKHWDAWELCNGLVELRVVHIGTDGGVSYSDKRAFPLVNPSAGYVELIGPMGNVYEPGRLPTFHFSDSFSNALPAQASGGDITIVDSGAGYRWYDEESKPVRVVSSTGYGGDLKIQNIDPSTEKVTGVYAASGDVGSGYSHEDILVPSPPAFFAINERMDLSARLRDPYGNFERVAFFLNGVEVDEAVQNRAGGVFGTSFSTDMSGDKFITARALYGDSRDMGPDAPMPFGHYPCAQNSYSGKDYWGWKKSWVQQHYSTGQEYLPTWFSQHKNYWIDVSDWDHKPMWDGAAPVRIGQVDAYESLVVLINSASLALQGELLHSQSTVVSATAEWAKGSAPEFSALHLYGNDILLKEIDFSDINLNDLGLDLNATGLDNNQTPSSQIDMWVNRIVWEIDWVVNYKQFKDDFGVVELKVIATTKDGRQITSGIKTATIRELDYNDPLSTAAMFYKDITGRTPSDADLDLIGPSVDGDSLGDVIRSIVDYNNQEEYEFMADLIAAYQVLYGEYHGSASTFFSQYNQWRDQFMTNRVNALNGFISGQIDSTSYTSRYGIIPTDRAHFFGASRGVNFSIRKNFVIRHYQNKYGRSPTVLQYIQASNKMWDFAGGAAAATNYAMNKLAAVDYIFNLATEPVERVGISGNIIRTYLNGMDSIRPQYLDKAKQYALSQADSHQQVANEAISESNSTARRVLQAIVEDQNLKRRFNLLWEDSKQSDDHEYWKHEDWFGYFMDEKYPWIYHVDLGWLYSSGTSQKNIWFYSQSIGWFWTNREIFRNHPNLTAENQRFIYRVRTRGDGGKEGSWSLVTLPDPASGSSSVRLYDYGYSPF
ncbi:MAG: hypothetical protein O3B07_06865, partial [Verrucomicrobia bacterium]|nr:hypothetical protein [Verrucomicrobiota bacterium]